jgi:hypothetical protein
VIKKIIVHKKTEIVFIKDVSELHISKKRAPIMIPNI